MLSSLPWVAVVVATVACGLRLRQKESEVAGFDWLLAAPLVLALTASFFAGPWELWPLFARGMVSGAFLGALAAWLLPAGVRSPSHLAAVLGLAAAATVPAHFLGNDDPLRAAHLQLGVIVGLGLAAVFASVRSAEVSGAGATAMVASGFVATDAMGRYRLHSMQEADASSPVSLLLPSAGLVLAIASAAAWVVAGLLERRARPAVAMGTGWILSLILGFLAVNRFLGLGGLTWVFGLGMAIGGAWWIFRNARDTDASWIPLLGGALPLALGGVAFSEGRGLGLALSLAAASIGMALAGRSVLCLGPLAGLTVLRLLREMTEGVRALDLLNHQAAMGLTAGLLLMALAGDIPAVGARGRLRFLGPLGWVLAVFATLLASASALGPRAAMALVLGSGVGLCLSSKKRLSGDRLAGVGMATVGSVVAAFGSVSAFYEQASRHDRLRWLGLAAVAALLATVMVAKSGSVGAEEEIA